jgi:hypothetical protein
MAALLLTFAAAALCAGWRLRLAPAAYRPPAFVFLLERPG